MPWRDGIEHPLVTAGDPDDSTPPTGIEQLDPAKIFADELKRTSEPEPAPRLLMHPEDLAKLHAPIGVYEYDDKPPRPRTDGEIKAEIECLLDEIDHYAAPSTLVIPTRSWLRVILTGMERRPLTLSAQDPLALLIAAGLGVAAELGAFDGYSSSLVVQLGALLMAIAAIGRHLLERRRDASLGRVFATIIDKVPAAKATIDEIRQGRHGAPGEGGKIEGELPDDDTPLPDPKRKGRHGLTTLGILFSIVCMVGAVLAIAVESQAGLAVGCGFFLLAWWAEFVGWARRQLRGNSVIPILALLLTGCAGLSTYQKPGLGDLVARVDLSRALQCWQQPTPRDKARCLGLEVLSQGVDLALNEAGKLAEAAVAGANPGAGAADLSERDERKLARETDAALNRLAHEIVLAQ